METPLLVIESKSSSRKLPAFILTFFLLLHLYRRCYRAVEVSLGAASGTPGSRVRLIYAFNGIPSGTEGFVVSPAVDVHNAVLVRLIDYPQRAYATISLHILNEVAPSHEANPGAWPFWYIIQRDPWYMERTCLGPLFCENEHECENANIVFFNRIAPMMHQIPERHIFSYSGHSHLQDQARLMHWIYSQMILPHRRLYCITLFGHHTFLIEQYGTEFRIYQSFVNSFDLQFWTNPSIPIESMCEPGQQISQDLLDAQRKFELEQVGIQDDKQAIAEAKARYGGLQSVSLNNITELIRCLSVAIELDSVRSYDNGVSLRQYPARVLFLHRNTKHWLGKSAILLSRIRQLGTPIRIEISYIEFVEPEKVSIEDFLPTLDTQMSNAEASSSNNPPQLS